MFAHRVSSKKAVVRLLADLEILSMHTHILPLTHSHNCGHTHTHTQYPLRRLWHIWWQTPKYSQYSYKWFDVLFVEW
jgi:hypothetical protein